MNQTRLCTAIKSIAWGFVLIHLHFNLGTIDLLPDFAGYLLILGALPVIGQEEPSALLLKPFCIFFVIWHVVMWILAIVGITDLGYLPSLLVSIIRIYFYFQLLTNLHTVAKHYQCPQERTILHLRTILTVMSTLFALPLPWNEQEAFTYLMMIVTFIVLVALCATLFSLHKSLKENTVDDNNF